jgi:type VI protein secretion system component VasK
LLEEKLPTEEEVQVKRRKAERWSLRLWTVAGAILYIALYWTIISEIIIGKGHVLGGVLFLLVVTVISIGGLLMLYSLSLSKRSAYSLSNEPQERDTSPESLPDARAKLKMSVTERTTELLDNNESNE